MLGGCPASGGASVGASSDNGQGVTRFDVSYRANSNNYYCRFFYTLNWDIHVDPYLYPLFSW